MAATGIRQRHGNGCNRPKSGCKCPWEAFVYSKRDGKKIRRTFPTKAEALSWRQDNASAVRRGIVRAPAPTTIEQAGEALCEGAKAGLVLTRSGKRYKPSAVRSYDTSLRLHVYPALGDVKVSELTLPGLQVFVNGLVAKGMNASTVSGALLPVRAIYQRR
jgi:hypothetical protein